MSNDTKGEFVVLVFFPEQDRGRRANGLLNRKTDLVHPRPSDLHG